MHTTFKLNVPDDAEATLTITASVGHLKRLRDKLSEIDRDWEFPVCDLKRVIVDAISAAEAHFLKHSASDLQKQRVPDQCQVPPPTHSEMKEAITRSGLTPTRYP